MEKSRKQIIEAGLLKYRGQLLSYAMSLTNNLSDAQDLLQDISLHILEKADKYNEKGYFCAWAKRTMKNQFLNGERNNKLRQTTGYDSIPISETPFSVSEADSNIDYSIIQNMISALPPKQATKFIRITEGYSYGEIANEESTSISNVKCHIHAARLTLKRRIGAI